MTRPLKTQLSLTKRRRIARVVGRKRILDTVLILVSVPVTLPLMLTTGLAIWLIDGSPVVFRQRRLGYLEQEFDVLKFRTMEAGDRSEDDRARITRLGSVLRRTSLDEIPQLLNVLRGQMSLVGPRPLYPEYAHFYWAKERYRHLVRPGITGQAQTSGRNAARWPQRLARDVEYVEQISIGKDLRILGLTLSGVMKGSGVSPVARDTGEPLNIERSYPNVGDVWIRRFNVLDVEDRVAWMNDRSVSAYMQLPTSVTVDSTVAWYYRTLTDDWRDDFVVYSADTGELLAMVGLKSEIGGSEGVLYIFVNPALQGRGIGKLALELLLKWARSSRYDSISLTVSRGNAAARRIYEATGFETVISTTGRLQYRLEFRAR